MMPDIWTDLKSNPSNVIVGHPVIGENCWIGHFTLLDGSGPLFIGNNVTVSSGVHIYTHEMSRRSKEKIMAPVHIHDDVVLGANAVIMPGCVIEQGATLGAGAVLTKNTLVKANEVWCGVPARKMKEAKK